MKVAIIGAGAVGGLLTARLGATDAEVTLVARPNAASAIRRNGLTMVTPLNRVARITPRVTDDSLSLGPQDVVLLCVKAHALRGTIDTLAPLLGPETAIVPMINGVPWWYPHRQPEPLADRPLVSVDPDGLLLALDRSRPGGRGDDLRRGRGRRPLPPAPCQRPAIRLRRCGRPGQSGGGAHRDPCSGRRGSSRRRPPTSGRRSG